MADQLVTITGRDLERYRRSTLKKLRGQMNAARRMFINNMAFEARKLYISYGIPRVMTVRAKGILRKATKVTKATRKLEIAYAGQVPGIDRFDSLRTQEFGGSMDNRHPANKAARGGSRSAKIKQKNRFRGGILNPDDSKAKHAKGREHRTHVFLERLQREKIKDPFIIRSMDKSGLGPGLLKLGKKTPRKGWGKPRKDKRGYNRKWRKREKYTYKIITLRTFKKGQTHIRKMQWMKPSNEKLIRTMDAKAEWRRVMSRALKRK